MNRYQKIFATDLDNTIIYSEKHTFQSEKICVESYDGHYGYMNKALYEQMPAYNKHIPFIPVTTRTLQQYERIWFPIIPDYAILLNGAILLHNGKIVDWWSKMIRDDYNKCRRQIDLALELIPRIHQRYPLRLIRCPDHFFVMIKTDFPEQTAEYFRQRLDLSKINIIVTGKKVYAMPAFLSKGMAVAKLTEFLGTEYMISAGDNCMDASMLTLADEIISCKQLKEWSGISNE